MAGKIARMLERLELDAFILERNQRVIDNDQGGRDRSQNLQMIVLADSVASRK